MVTETRVIQGLIRRGVVTGSDAAGMMQIIQSEDFQTRAAEHFEPYGFTSRPLDGAETIMVRIGGTTHAICLVATDRRYRPKNLVKGEVALYDHHGHRVHLTTAGVGIIGDTTITGDASATGSINAGTSVSAGTSIVAGGVVSGASGAFGPLSCSSFEAGGGAIPLPGATGTFLSGDAIPKTVTVVNGIVTSIA